MSDTGRPRILAIMGSGETSPTMVTIHKDLASRLGAGERTAILLDTPYAFQENVADISARAQSYFARSVGLRVTVASGADPAEIRGADWVFAGPGSPSYALRRWRGSPVAGALRERIAAGAGLTVIASAAAAAIGQVAVPVYEIYKVGADPYWLDGLDLLSVLGLRVAVIPHYDNAEGGTHDTRFCYLGERRLAMLERELPSDAAVLGVDEHTALVFDLAAGQAQVLGRGGATIRKAGRSTVFPSGAALSLGDLRELVRTGVPAPGAITAPPGSTAPPGGTGGTAGAGGTDGAGGAGERDHGVAEDGDAGDGAAADDQALPLSDLTARAQGRFDAAARVRDAAAMAGAILDLEAGIHAWSADTDENDDADRARAVLRGLITRLGRAAQEGLADPADRLRPAVEPLITIRAALRKDGSYAAADAIRDALAAAGVLVRDSPGRTCWSVASPDRR